MEPMDLLEILKVSSRLKTTMRHCWTMEGRQESVADHSWRTALMALLLKDEEEFREYDMDKVMEMCLIHDLGEAFTGDIPTFLKKKSDEAGEEKIFDEWVASFPKAQREHWQALLAEMNGLRTDEAKIYKCLDKLEALISHNESDISTWLQLEYDLQFAYGKENMKDFAYFVKFREAVDAWTQEKIDTEKPQ
ncbi:MAG: HD domain-containing protein [Solobacterium sp.]|nr:HD domain-containing protein [Solobacterium sp.]